MFSLSPSFGFPFEWQLEELDCDGIMLASYIANSNATTASHNSSNSSPRLQEFEDDEHPNSTSTNAIDRISNSAKQSSHNEYERDRRKKLNKLYSSLRELLPEKDKRKKLSIPCTIACVLKYIPELQRHIERLACKEEEILLRASKNEFGKKFNEGMINPEISATLLGRREIMIQICTINTSAMTPLSKILKILEKEGLDLMNATTQTTHDGKIIYSLHLQVRDEMRLLESQIFCKRLMSSLVS